MATNLESLEKTIAVMEADGRLGDSDTALIGMARALAQALDDGAKCTCDCALARHTAPAAIWREYRAAVTALREAGEASDGDDDTAAFRLTIQTPRRAEVGDPA